MIKVKQNEYLEMSPIVDMTGFVRYWVADEVCVAVQ